MMRLARPRAWLRLVAALVVLTLGWQVSLAYAVPCTHPGADGAASDGDGCCPDDRVGAEHPDAGDGAVLRAAGDGESGGCPCPIDCSPCCAGAVMHALPSMTLPAIRVLADFVELPEPYAHSSAVHADPHDILHVPRFA